MPRDLLTVEALLPYRFGPSVPDRPRVFCFHHAGGEPSVYQSLIGPFAPYFDLQPVRLPRVGVLPSGGRSDDAQAVVEAIGNALESEIADPFILFGHSMGAVLAAELTAWLQRRGSSPRLLVVSARTGAGTSPVGPDGWDDEALIGWLTSLGGTVPDVLAEPEMRHYILTATRHDLRLLRGYRTSFETVFAPILAVGGQADAAAPADQLRQWRHRTTAGYRLKLFSGGHFYLYLHARELAATIARELRRTAGLPADVVGGAG